MRSIIFSFVVLFMVACQPAADQSSSNVDANYTTLNLNLDDAGDNLTAFAKVRGSLTQDEEVIYYANGAIYGIVDGERDKHMMDYEMYNIGRLNKTEEGYELLTREVLLYTDKGTGEVLEKFTNPYTESDVDVLHVWNDPVNQKFQLEGRFGKWGVNHNKVGNDMECMNADVLLAYPSPLTMEEYPENSQSDLYEAGELFQFFFSEKDLNNADKKSTDCTISWTRIGPWLPWLKMGQKPGKMLYQGAGYKLLEKDFEDMPAVLRDYVMANKPEYRHAPEAYSSPNETSWTYYKKMNPR